MTEPVDLFSQQALNRSRSRRLTIGFILFFAWLGFGADVILWLSAAEERTAGAYRHGFPWLGILMTGLAAGMTWWAWRKGADSVLWSTGAWELLEPADDKQRQLINVVEEMAIASGLPKPRIFLVFDPDPNAFATGRDPQTACVAVTQGLLDHCSRDELQAVIAHELGHVKNLDVQLMTLLTGLLGSIVLVRDGLFRALRSGAFGGSGRGGSGGKKGGNPIVLALLALWIVSWLLAPLVTRLMILGVSRRREFLADAMSAQFTRNPLALASALEKIERAAEPTASIKAGCAHLCIADPLGRASSLKEGWVADLLGTHPPMPLRVSRLKAMAYQEMKRQGSFPVAPVV